MPGLFAKLAHDGAKSHPFKIIGMVMQGSGLIKKRFLDERNLKMATYNIILAEDHVLVRQGIKKIIQEDGNLKVVGEAGDGIELLELLQKVTPNLIILDISMPRLRGLAAAEKIKKLYPDIKILILSMHRSKEYLHQAMASGVDGYLLKEDADVGLFAAIETVRQGKRFVSPFLES
jgi:DNA-binding NarL/FixJ family response regulator